MLYREIIAVCAQIHTKHINTPWHRKCYLWVCIVTFGSLAWNCATQVGTAPCILTLSTRWRWAVSYTSSPSLTPAPSHHIELTWRREIPLPPARYQTQYYDIPAPSDRISNVYNNTKLTFSNRVQLCLAVIRVFDAAVWLGGRRHVTIGVYS